MDKFTDGINVIAVDPFMTMCGSKHCKITYNGSSLYFDDNHLSVFGATKLVRESVLGFRNEIDHGIGL